MGFSGMSNARNKPGIRAKLFFVNFRDTIICLDCGLKGIRLFILKRRFISKAALQDVQIVLRRPSQAMLETELATNGQILMKLGHEQFIMLFV